VAKIICPCGNVLSDNSDLLYYKARYIPDQLWNEFTVRVDEAIEQSGPSQQEKAKACMDIRELHLTMFRDIFQCPDCGTLLFEDRNRMQHNFSQSPQGNKLLLKVNKN